MSSSWYPFSSSNAQSGTSGGGGGGVGSWMNIETSQVRAAATGDLTGETSAYEALGFKLTRQERLTGFIACMGIGFALSIVGSIMLFLHLTTLFAVLYSVGILVSLMGTGFLVGFMRQLRLMFKPVRVVATGILFGSFVLVWIFAFAVRIAILTLIFVIILYLAFLWYTLSYIPFARDFVRGIFSRFI